MVNRRQAIKGVMFAALAASVGSEAIAQSIIFGRYQPLFKLPPLPYAFDALEPYIDAQTMEIHHDKHHAAYVANLEAAIGQVPGLYSEILFKGMADESGEGLLRNLGSLPEKVRTTFHNNGGGHYNHSLFWQMMKKGGGGEPKGELADTVTKNFGSFNEFKDRLTNAAVGLFGSGWAWLTLDAGALKIETTSNQDTPWSAGRPVLLGVDVWEHAYYLKYQNRRADYIAAWFNLINWDFVVERYERFRSGAMKK